jgi:hypothetical protein
MENKDNLYELFRSNEHKLHEHPSSDVWRRLETRLEEHRRRRRYSVLRPLAMAAALTLLVGLIALFTWTAGEQAPASSAQIEELPLAPNAELYAQNLVLRAYYESAQPEEDEVKRRLVVNPAP